MGKIDIRRIDEFSDESVNFQKIEKKKAVEVTEPVQVKKSPKRKK